MDKKGEPNTFDLKKPHCNPKQLSPLALAFVGDAVFGLMVRERLLDKGSMPVAKLHKRSVEYVCAKSQFEFSLRLAEHLTPEEQDIFRRGRNASGNHIPKSSSPREYRAATGVEALFGYLYLQGDLLRLSELFDVMVGFGDKT